MSSPLAPYYAILLHEIITTGVTFANTIFIYVHIRAAIVKKYFQGV